MTLARRAAFLLAAAAVLTSGSAALAADYDPPIYVEQPDEYVPVEVGNGWYLRGDVGYAFKTDVDAATYRIFDAPTGTYFDSRFDTSSMDENFTLGLGAGYRFTDWLRADATVDGFRSDFSGTTSSAFPCNGTAGTTCASQDSATMSAISLMGNGYIDLGTYVGITPYVGAGAGMTYVSWSDLQNQNSCVAGTGVCNTVGLPVVSHEGGKDWRFTYAFMAGAAYDLSKSLKLDVGYKYRHIDGGDMFGFDAGSQAAGATGTQGKDGDLTQHEVRVGLRYELW
jgi:opacity protein-like surface antigen